MRCLLAFSLVTACRLVHAFQVEETPAQERYEVLNGIPVVSIGETSFSIYEIPAEAPQYEISSRADTHADLKAKLKLGGLVLKDEAIKVLEIYYRNTAIDFGSIVIRDVKVDTEPKYAVWCGNPFILGCLEWKGAAGTLVEYAINGKNRSGGMAGFKNTYQLIRKFSTAASLSPPATSAPEAAQSQLVKK